jgi:hypothetical protein
MLDSATSAPSEVPATKDAVLFLWATSPLLPEAFERHPRLGLRLQGFDGLGQG